MLLKWDSENEKQKTLGNLGGSALLEKHLKCWLFQNKPFSQYMYSENTFCCHSRQTERGIGPVNINANGVGPWRAKTRSQYTLAKPSSQKEWQPQFFQQVSQNSLFMCQRPLVTTEGYVLYDWWHNYGGQGEWIGQQEIRHLLRRLLLELFMTKTLRPKSLDTPQMWRITIINTHLWVYLNAFSVKASHKFTLYNDCVSNRVTL